MINDCKHTFLRYEGDKETYKPCWICTECKEFQIRTLEQKEEKNEL